MNSLTLIKILTFSFFLFLYGAVYFVATQEKEEQVQLTLEHQVQDLEDNYKVIANRFKTISDNFYTLVLNQPEITEIIYKAKHSKNDAQRAVLRTMLYTKVKPLFEHLKKSGVNIVLFSFEDNRAFLRVHKPDKYGDDLSSVRYSFEYVNSKKEIIRGFEQGKISHAFRNLFPLYHNGEYVGSVDISFSSEVLQENMTLLHATDTHFIINKTLFESNIWKYKANTKYLQSIEHKDFLFAPTPEHKENYFAENKLILNKSLKEKIDKNIKHGKSFSLYEKTDTNVELITFVPIVNIKKTKTAAYLVTYSTSFHLQSVIKRYFLSIILFFIGFSILYFMIMYNVQQRYLLQMQVKEEVEKNRLQDKKLLEQSKIAQDKLNKSITLFGENVISSNSDTKGIITYASQALCDISGYSHEELLGQAHNILRHPDMASFLFKDMWETIQAGKTWDGEVKNRKKNGEYYWVKTSVMPDFDAQGKIIGYSSIRHEITSQKVKEEFMANMSHELRTPLNAIIGFSGILKKKMQGCNEYGLINQISASASSLLILINDILDLSKIQDSKFTIEPYEFNAYDEITEYSKNFDGLTAQKELVFKNSISKNLEGIFYGDWLRISQIILNLVSNAIKFTPQDGKIECSVDYLDNSLVIKISDNGIGMSKETQDKIFKPFQQADGSTTRKYGGTGLGLSITQSLVELMHGTIELESQEDVGSTFKVTIPLQRVHKPTPIEEKPHQAEDALESLNAHILVVEDNKTNQMLLEMLLEDFGITCDIVNDGVEAVNTYEPSLHALVLMDENMPNMNGLEAMKILKEKYKEKCTPIVALTANAMKGDSERFIQQGMDGYVSKPIDDKVLYEIIKELLSK